LAAFDDAEADFAATVTVADDALPAFLCSSSSESELLLLLLESFDFCTVIADFVASFCCFLALVDDTEADFVDWATVVGSTLAGFLGSLSESELILLLESFDFGAVISVMTLCCFPADFDGTEADFVEVSSVAGATLAGFFGSLSESELMLLLLESFDFCVGATDFVTSFGTTAVFPNFTAPACVASSDSLSELLLLSAGADVFFVDDFVDPPRFISAAEPFDAVGASLSESELLSLEDGCFVAPDVGSGIDDSCLTAANFTADAFRFTANDSSLPDSASLLLLLLLLTVASVATFVSFVGNLLPTFSSLPELELGRCRLPTVADVQFPAAFFLRLFAAPAK